MASQNQFLANWVKGAYGMELGLAPMLEQQATRLDDDTELHKSLSLHLEKTRRHASLLRERLQRMGEDVSVIRPIAPVTTAIGHLNGGRPDPARQTELLDYVAETFEVASYRALQSLAEMLGDQETGRVCEQILADELAISEALSRRLPSHNGHRDAQTSANQGNAALAREVFAALNAHNLDLFDKLVAKDYRADLPGETRQVNLADTHIWLQGFFAAFPDLHYQTNQVASGGDTTFVEWTATGTHSGPFRLMNGPTIPATNRKVKFDGVTIFQFHNDKLTHSRVISDTGSVMRQLGMLPGAEKGTSPVASTGREIVHLEIPALDRRVTARFYGEMFGWQYEHMDAPVNYTTFQSGTVRGGFPDVNEMNPPGEVLFYVDSRDIESDVRRAESLGAKMVVPRTEIPDRGHFAILSDPGGNHFGLYSRNLPA
jgi:predicted enzyme related to lactoylglutathione lyase/ferritin-like metal-binding protein YciE/predicted ester cyclase